MQYTEYWRIRHSPFLVAGGASNETLGEPIYCGGSVGDALHRAQLISRVGGGAAILVGPALVGKTTVLRRLLHVARHEGNREHIRTVYLSLLGASVDDVLRSSAEQLLPDEAGLRRTETDRSRLWLRLEDALRANLNLGRRILLVVDDAHDGSFETFSLLRRVVSLASVTLILAAASDRLLDLPRAVVDRCQMKIQLPAWDLEQTAHYFEHCMDRCKGRDEIFDAAAINRIHEISGGSPYRINYLADAALLAGAESAVDRIDANLIDRVSGSLDTYHSSSDSDFISYDPASAVA